LQQAGDKNSIIRKETGEGLGGFRVGEEGGAGGGEEAFEEEGGGNLIDDGRAVETLLAIEAGGVGVGAGSGAGGVAGEVEEGVGVVGGEALVEEVVGEGGVGFAEGLGEGLSFGGLGAGCAVGVEGIADEEDFDVVLADEAADGFEVGSYVWFGAGAVEGEEGLSGEAEGVGDGEADAAVADVERESAGMGHGDSVRRKESRVGSKETWRV
jgi:hypothetical protein